ncbi:hypothetical protein PoB_002197400 [Plakobranchus ocellatus]|uniref:Uncharacterized protein n=1 Tax=Plakobranchus ocellatus TaxID=259542 RepID=A0AAV3ZNM1_9GAST|nr:hypothetical protein PoB_002197400 [Plakobranchus ocellatus]
MSGLCSVLDSLRQSLESESESENDDLDLDGNSSGNSHALSWKGSLQQLPTTPRPFVRAREQVTGLEPATTSLCRSQDRFAIPSATSAPRATKWGSFYEIQVRARQATCRLKAIYADSADAPDVGSEAEVPVVRHFRRADECVRASRRELTSQRTQITLPTRRDCRIVTRVLCSSNLLVARSQAGESKGGEESNGKLPYAKNNQDPTPGSPMLIET